MLHQIPTLSLIISNKDSAYRNVCRLEAEGYEVRSDMYEWLQEEKRRRELWTNIERSDASNGLREKNKRFFFFFSEKLILIEKMKRLIYLCSRRSISFWKDDDEVNLLCYSKKFLPL